MKVPGRSRWASLRVLAVLGCLAGILPGQGLKAVPGKAPFHPTRLLVGFKDDGQAAARQAAIGRQGLKVRRQFRSPGLERLAVLDVADENEGRAARTQAPAARLRRMQERLELPVTHRHRIRLGARGGHVDHPAGVVHVR